MNVFFRNFIINFLFFNSRFYYPSRFDLFRPLLELFHADFSDFFALCFISVSSHSNSSIFDHFSLNICVCKKKFHEKIIFLTNPLDQGPPKHRENRDFLSQQNILEYNFPLKRCSFSLPLVVLQQRRNYCRFVALVVLNLLVAVWIIQLRWRLHHSKIATIMGKLSFYTEIHKFDIYLPRVIPQKMHQLAVKRLIWNQIDITIQ